MRQSFAGGKLTEPARKAAHAAIAQRLGAAQLAASGPVLLRLVDGWLAELPLARRKKVPGIDPARADIIIAGARILSETLRELNLGGFTATIHGLRRGLVLDEGRRTS